MGNNVERISKKSALPKRPDVRTTSWLNPKSEVRKTCKYGKGVFAKTRISVGKLLCVFGGRIIPAADECGDYGIQLSEDFTMLHTKEDAANFINHSCNPNAGIQGQIMLVAMRDIETNEEIVFDYAMCLHPSPGAERYEMKCGCGSPNCRGKVTEDDWRLPELQRQYKGYFSWYIQEKIDKLNKAQRRKKAKSLL